MQGTKKEVLPKYCYVRGHKIWVRYKNENGIWLSKPTPYTDDQVEQARRYVKALFKGVTAMAEMEDRGASVSTVKLYAEKWLKDRDDRKVAAAVEDRSRLEKYALPILGDIDIDEIRPKHVLDMVRQLKARQGDAQIAPRMIRHVYNTLHNMFENAVIDELILANPVKVRRGELPSKVDADPEWRSQATFTVREVERLISDPVIPVERRVLYALKALAGLRHGEAAALCWRHLDYTAEPLARINVVQAFSTRHVAVKSTKTKDTRAVPMHPTLAKILAAWKLTHWERIYGRAPRDDDFVVPARTMYCVAVGDAGKSMKTDLAALGMRVMAGSLRARGGHDLRSWYETRLIEDGASSVLVRRTTHAPPKDVAGGYERFSWEAICREISKLKVEILDGKVLELATGSLQSEKKAGARWTSVVTPSGLEGDGLRRHQRAQDEITEDDFRSHTGSRPDKRVLVVASLVTGLRMLERAIMAGDTSRALVIVKQLQELEQEHKSMAS